jgi:hypothetical protein
MHGNGYKIIQSVMEEKQGWQEIKQDDLWEPINMARINFIWKPCSFNPKQFSMIDQAA